MTAVDIHAFNLARVAEDEAAIQRIDDHSEPWRGQWTIKAGTLYTHNGWCLAVMNRDHPWNPQVLEHITRHDPARALREAAAKRRVLERHRPANHPNYRFYDTDPIVYTCVGCGYDTNSCGEHEPRTEDINDCPELRDIAAIYADHEDYAPKWSETP